MEEKYYWETQDGRLIPVHELTQPHICNIVMKFGKDRLHEIGHSIIVERFETLNKEYNFFNIENKKSKSIYEEDAIKYMENVLVTWKEFCKDHQKFADNLNIILDILKR